MPALVVGGVVMPLFHPSQIASALGLEATPAGESARLGWDLASVLDGWLAHLRAAGSELVTAPTPSRGRSARNLTVNVFRPVGMLPDAWTRGHFEWDPDEDAAVEETLRSPEGLTAWAEGIWSAWTGFLLGAADELGGRDPAVSTLRGPLTYSQLLASQRWHAAFHYRQLVEFLRGRGVQPPPRALRPESLADLELPADVF